MRWSVDDVKNCMKILTSGLSRVSAVKLSGWSLRDPSSLEVMVGDNRRFGSITHSFVSRVRYLVYFLDNRSSYFLSIDISLILVHFLPRGGSAFMWEPKSNDAGEGLMIVQAENELFSFQREILCPVL